MFTDMQTISQDFDRLSRGFDFYDDGYDYITEDDLEEEQELLGTIDVSNNDPRYWTINPTNKELDFDGIIRFLTSEDRVAAPDNKQRIFSSDPTDVPNWALELDDQRYAELKRIQELHRQRFELLGNFWEMKNEQQGLLDKYLAFRKVRENISIDLKRGAATWYNFSREQKNERFKSYNAWKTKLEKQLADARKLEGLAYDAYVIYKAEHDLQAAWKTYKYFEEAHIVEKEVVNEQTGEIKTIKTLKEWDDYRELKKKTEELLLGVSWNMRMLRNQEYSPYFTVGTSSESDDPNNLDAQWSSDFGHDREIELDFLEEDPIRREFTWHNHAKNTRGQKRTADHLRRAKVYILRTRPEIKEGSDHWNNLYKKLTQNASERAGF